MARTSQLLSFIARASRLPGVSIRGVRRWGPTVYRGVLAGGLLVLAAGCNAFSIQQDAELGAKSYASILADKEGKLLSAGPEVDQAKRVTDRLVEAAREYHPEIVNAFDWKVAVIDEPDTANAFALPGGKMACYTGILAVAGDDAGLAVVMGHEIAHVTERHGTQAMTRAYGLAFLTAVIFTQSDEDAQKLAALAANRLLTLKFGRGAELEADRVGLRYMARAGYDPREAVEFWTRMSAGGGSRAPEWLSTHPSHENRISRLQAELPQAIAIYEASRPRQ